MSKNKELTINKRVLNNEEISNLKENKKSEYEKLKSKLIELSKDNIYNKLETAKILKQINQEKLYLFDNYKSFSSFISDFNIAKTIAYKYIKLAFGIESGVIDYNFVSNKGIEESIRTLEDKKIISKSRQNSIKPLRFQLKSQDSYSFYKENSKFTSFLMDFLYEKHKNLIDTVLIEYYKSKK